MVIKYEFFFGILDFGGVEIYLEGGDYFISYFFWFFGKSGGNFVVCFLFL